MFKDGVGRKFVISVISLAGLFGLTAIDVMPLSEFKEMFILVFGTYNVANLAGKK